MALELHQIDAVLGRPDALPAFPEVVMSLERELRKQTASVHTVARIVESDPTLSARFLSAANSAFYSRGQLARTVLQAVGRLGLFEVRRIVVATAVLQRFGSLGGTDPKAFWIHSVAVALATRIMARMARAQLNPVVVEAAYIGGLLHDIGIVLLLHHFSDDYAGVIAHVDAEGGGTSEAERAVLGVDHTVVGERIAVMWKLPDEVCATLRFHHHPWDAPAPIRSLVYLVHLADFVCNNQGYSRSEAGFPMEFDDGSWEALGLTIEQIPEIIEKVKEEGSRSEGLWDLSS